MAERKRTKKKTKELQTPLPSEKQACWISDHDADSRDREINKYKKEEKRRRRRRRRVE
jgi:hypothetical protein